MDAFRKLKNPTFIHPMQMDAVDNDPLDVCEIVLASSNRG
jgi:hypothetical protein